MASLHNALTRGPWTTAVKAILGFTKSDGGIERFGETLMPVLDLWERPEFAFLRQEKLCVQQATVGAVVGELGAYALVNSAGSNSIVVVEAAGFQSAVIASFGRLSRVTETAARATLGTSVGHGTGRDSRDLTLPGMAEGISGTDPAGIGALMELHGQDVANTGFFFQTPPYIIAPGQALVIQDGTANEAFTGFFKWYERAAFRGELPS